MNAHTKQQQDKVFETDFIDSQKSDPTFAHLLALSHMTLCQKEKVCMKTGQRWLKIKLMILAVFLEGAQC